MEDYSEMRWWIGPSEEHYDCDLSPGSTREDAIAEGRGQYGDDQGFWIIRASKSAPFLPDAAKINELFLSINEDLGGEDVYFGEDFAVLPEAEAELTESFQKLYSEWLTKNNAWPHVYTFGKTEGQEFIPPIEGENDNGTA